MEIALINSSSIRIKGKQGSLIINPPAKVPDANGYLLFRDGTIDREKVNPDSVIITGPGEYEFGGIKVNGIRNDTDFLYSIKVDKIEVLAGTAETMGKDYAKLHDHNIVLLCVNNVADTSFVTSLALNTVIFHGEKAAEAMKSFAGDGYRTESKYTVTFEKLPQEVEKILLQ